MLSLKCVRPCFSLPQGSKKVNVDYGKRTVKSDAAIEGNGMELGREELITLMGPIEGESLYVCQGHREGQASVKRQRGQEPGERFPCGTQAGQRKSLRIG